MGQPGRGDARSRPGEHIAWCEVSEGTETSQYLEERRSTEIPQVVVSERGRAQTIRMSSVWALCGWGCRTRCEEPHLLAGSQEHSRTVWEGRPERVRAP